MKTCVGDDWNEFGFTTGMAAAAATAGALDHLLNAVPLSHATIETPDGRRRLTIEIERVRRAEGCVTASVIKRAGPDRDVTDGLLVEAGVTPNELGRVRVFGGAGIGTVTLPGLATAPGRPAINPAPLAHIERIAIAALPGGADVTIAAPDGVRLASRTFNARLGIVGGISILGTSGLVRPMSLTAWKSALLPQLDQAKALGHMLVAMTFGNLGASAAADKLALPDTAIVQMGNFAGYMLRAGAAREMDMIVIGHLGKIIKLAYGYENTHHLRTPDRLVLLARFVSAVNPESGRRIAELPSAEAAATFLAGAGPDILDGVAEKTGQFIRALAPKRRIGALITNLAGEIIGSEPRALTMMADLS